LEVFDKNGGWETVRDFSAHLIAVGGSPRNNALLPELSTLGFFTTVELVDAVVPTELDQETLAREKFCAETLLGRDVTPIEICITKSHEKCYKNALRKGSKLALVLEDDALIRDIKAFKLLIENIQMTQKPTIWTFYSPNWSIWKNSNQQLKSVIPPAYAVCYLINESAMQIATTRRPIGLADWPVWSNKVDFFLILNSSVKNLESNSFAETGRVKAKIKKHALKSMLTPKYITKVSILNRLRYILFYPLIWKVLLYFSKFDFFIKTSYIVNHE
jgi:GR25 family glycosyltransferase involved in LPS biosynthesis